MDCAELFEALQHVTNPDVQKRIADAVTECPGRVYQLWYPWRKHSHVHDIPRDTWVWLFRTAGYTDNYEPAPLPDSPTLLYRGASDDRRLGMSWSANYNVAKGFAVQDSTGRSITSRNIYTHWAWGEEMLAHFAYWEGEASFDEYVLDHCCLNDGNVHLFEVPTVSYPQMFATCLTEGRSTVFGML